jgi:phosphopantothenoylcysteine decarboxylase/phosphopantothenate--cysteine ligase
VYNDVSEPGSGFGTDTNRVVVIDSGGGADEWPVLSKEEVAERLLDRVVEELARKG